ncbi:MAG: YfiR family protein [Candidatus Kapaibacterium sp.]|nr:MAG: YfiR family protein [Candidatus Kapabacteria bacterium]
MNRATKYLSAILSTVRTKAVVWCGVVVIFFAVAPSMHGSIDEALKLIEAKTTGSQQIAAEEEKLQALYVWQFLQFIEFPTPTTPQEPFIVGVLGITRVENYLQEVVRQKQLGEGRSVEVRRLGSVEDALRCNTIFIAPGETIRTAQLLAKTRSKPILTIGRDDGFLDKGGLINFYVENAKVRFEYNAEEIPSSKLRFSSKLLRLGKSVSKK